MARQVDYIKIGYTLASKIEEAEAKAGKTKRMLLTSIIEKYHNKEELDSIVQGYEQFYIEQGVTKAIAAVRKSEVLALFKSALRGEGNLAKLQAFQGTYHAWLTYARSLKGKRSEDQPHTERKPRTPKLTEKGEENIKVKLIAANDAQLVGIVSDTVSKMIERPGDGGALPILHLIQSQAKMLVQAKQFDKATQSIGHKILEIVEPFLASIEAQETVKHAKVA